MSEKITDNCSTSSSLDKLHIDNEAVLNFTDDIGVMRAMYMSGAAGISLAEHAEEMNEAYNHLNLNLASSYEDAMRADVLLWPSLIAQATRLGYTGEGSLLDAYAYFRTTRMLSAEFDGHETPTVSVVRSIAYEAVDAKLQTVSADEITRFFLSTFSTHILEKVYVRSEAMVLHPALHCHLAALQDQKELADDPALFRIILNLRFAGHPEELKIPDSIRIRALLWRVANFKSGYRQTENSASLESEGDTESFDGSSNDEDAGNDIDTPQADNGTVQYEFWKFPGSEKAACRPDLDDNDPPEVRAAQINLMLGLMFPRRGEPASPAKEYCEVCPVQQECLDFAVQSSIKFGIWGGATERERRRMRKAQALAQRKKFEQTPSED